MKINGGYPNAPTIELTIPTYPRRKNGCTLELAQKLKETQRQDDGWNSIDTPLHVVSSPYIRCIETADAVAKELDTSIKVEPGISEVNSSRHPGFLTVWKS